MKIDRDLEVELAAINTAGDDETFDNYTQSLLVNQHLLESCLVNEFPRPLEDFRRSANDHRSIDPIAAWLGSITSTVTPP